jgi:dTDP-4-amino-4,6-dideoxygalactose transaminase
VKPGDEVIITPLTFCATVNAIFHAGTTPILAHVDARTLNIDPSLVEASITSKTRGILPVHFAGRRTNILYVIWRNDMDQNRRVRPFRRIGIQREK